MNAVHVSGRSTGKRTALQKSAVAAGILFVLVGGLGFVPGTTSGTDAMAFWGHQSGAMLFGVFQVSVLHNLVHLATGVVGLFMSRLAMQSRTFLIGAGVAYLAMWILGLIIPHDSPLNVVPFSSADNWLHVAFGLGLIGLGVAFARDAVSPPKTAHASVDASADAIRDASPDDSTAG
ncbi:DUF4383 domain-containing protein [Arthrobacter sp.]|uniref:DUF4383 domain-containing protein n=1 Tax=Arthrobacter sp. TaxID=1667 RepID=UPI0028113F9B|nr:DUF4383 domain-containing protein [Arthrobacter sp.]